MGCDIHGWIERKVGDKYVAICELSEEGTQRNYARFAALAGVRGDGPQARGIPPDVSDTARYWIDSDGPDGHSHSWLPLVDAVRIYADTAPTYQKPVQDPILHYFGMFESEPDDRVVFWFDN